MIFRFALGSTVSVSGSCVPRLHVIKCCLDSSCKLARLDRTVKPLTLRWTAQGMSYQAYIYQGLPGYGFN
jgi:hypothetical protein